jgi:hypothetical protein
MKNILVLCLIVAAAYFGYTKFLAPISGPDASQFDLAKIEQQPIPKEVLFQLWKEVALQRCADASKNHNLTPNQCREKVSERHPNCARSAADSAPKIVREITLSKQLGRQYLECATPYYFCNGVEVRTEEEARRYCQ